jgi:uncharacterized membrane protein YhhN
MLKLSHPSRQRYSSLLIPAYFMVCLLYLCLGGIGVSQIWTIVVKGLILPVLIVYFHLRVRGKYTPLRQWVLAGLVFSWFGDVLISFEFLYGLVAFLFAHLTFIRAFSRGCGLLSLLRAGRPYAVPVAVYGVVFQVVLFPYLGPMAFPALAYTAVILLMLLAALARKEWVSGRAYWLTVAGAVLFVLSDFLLSIRTFMAPFPLSGILIMGTYATAEFLIAQGAIWHEG